MVTVKLATSLCSWLYDGDWFQMVAELICWRLFSLCWWFSQCIKSVTNILNRSPTSQTCHQNIWSPTSVTNIDVTSRNGTKYWNRWSFANQILNLIKQNHLIQSLVAGYVENQRGFVQLVFPSLDRCHQFLQNFQIRNGIEIYFTNSALTGDRKMEELIQKYNLQSEFLGTFMNFFLLKHHLVVERGDR